MAPTPHRDAAARTADAREQLRRLDDLTAQAAVAPDIQLALADPGVSRYRKAVGFQVVDRYEDLDGPGSGTVAVPRRLQSHENETVELNNTAAVAHLYRRLLHDGTPDEQAQLINPELLRALWSDELAEPVVIGVWEDRFPTLRGQRD